MSNIEISKLQQLSSNEFLEHIKNDETIDDYFYNHLLVIHLLSILHNTTGVIEGGFNFVYQTEIDLKKDKAELLVELKNSFFVYNIKNQLIENTERCSRGNCNFKNNLFFLKNNYFLKKFIEKYLNENKKNKFIKNDWNILSNMNFLIKEESIKFRIENPSKRFSVESQEEGYENIVTKNKKYFSYIEKYFLNKELKNYNVIKKIKI